MTTPSGRAAAAARWPNRRITGAGWWAVACSAGPVTLTSSRGAADAAAALLNRFRCGRHCSGPHEIHDLAGAS